MNLFPIPEDWKWICMKLEMQDLVKDIHSLACLGSATVTRQDLWRLILLHANG